MKVKELIEILKNADPNAELYVRFMNGDAYGSAWVDNALLSDEDHILIENDCVYIDISDN